MKTIEEIIDDATLIECAVARAGANGEEAMLMLERRDGRTPIKEVVITDDGIAWICADDAVETPFLSGSTGEADLKKLIHDARRDGILVTEMSDEDTEKPISNWLMQARG